MPAATRYITDTRSNEYRNLEEVYAAEYTERAKRFERHWAYYDGVMEPPLKREKDGYNDNVLLPLASQVADKIVSFLLGDGIRFDAGEDDDTESPEDEAIEGLWKASRGALSQHNIALSGALCGHCWVRIEPREGLPTRIVPQNPAHCSAFWQADDVSKVLWYRLQYTTATGGKRVDYVKGRPVSDGYDHEADGWMEYTYVQAADKSEWVLLDSPKRLPWEWPPIVEWQNLPRPHGFYGLDDVAKSVALNDAVNFVASTYQRILKHHAHPKTIGLGMEPAEVVPSDIGGFWTVAKDKTTADIFNLEMQSDLTSSREFLAILASQVWQAARMTDPQSLKDRVGTLTNFGLRVLYIDAVRKTETKRQLYEEGLVEVTKRALQMGGQAAPEAISIVWPDALPEDDAETARVIMEQLGAGIISKETARRELGYDPEAEEERVKGEQETENDLGQRLLADFAAGRGG